ncbi:hypothetical protein [uncultured Desulfobacter sp.]|uniref:hypothetical protein n=1 Tax=uncultured Desulfobacter sp. TaxID=240139 RepID=UPI002D1E4811|nr:hypothetical protein [uncultured Desulfobacter sp.]
MNNTPVVVIFIPIVMALSCECDFSQSTMLIPLSYVSILAVAGAFRLGYYTKPIK